MGGDVPVDSKTLLVIDFVNLKIKLAQSFGDVHRGKVCIRMFIGVSARTCMSICICTMFLKNNYVIALELVAKLQYVAGVLGFMVSSCSTRWDSEIPLICRLTMKNPRMSKEMRDIINKYARAEEATLDNRDTKNDKEPSQSDQPGTSKNNNKKIKPGRSVANIEQPHHNRTEYRPQTGEFEGFLDRICIFHPRGNKILGTVTDCKDLQTKF
jgi:hypothetical protein